MRRSLLPFLLAAAAGVLSAAACSSSAAPSATSGTTTHGTTAPARAASTAPPAAAAAPSAATPAASTPGTTATTPAAASPADTTSCKGQMHAWYNGIGVSALSGVGGGGKVAIADLRNEWNSLAAAPALATVVVTGAHLEAIAITKPPAVIGPPACNQLAAVAWSNAMADLAKAGAIEKASRTLPPPDVVAAQDATAAFSQFGIVTTQGQLAG